MRPSSCPRADADAATGPQPRSLAAPRHAGKAHQAPHERRQANRGASHPAPGSPAAHEAGAPPHHARKAGNPARNGNGRHQGTTTGRPDDSATRRLRDRTTRRQRDSANRPGLAVPRPGGAGPGAASSCPARGRGLVVAGMSGPGRGGAAYAPTRPSPVSPPKDAGRKSRTPSGSTSRSIRFPDQESTGAPKASPIAPPSRHPRTRSAYDP